MTRLAWASRFVRIGVTPDTPPTDARCVLLGNAIAALCMLLCALTLALLLATGVGLGDPSRAWQVTLVTFAVSATVPLLNHRGAWRLATLVLVLATTAATVGQALNLGPGSTGYQYLLGISIYPCFAFPARDSRLALGLSAGIAASFVAVALAYMIWPWPAAPVLGKLAYVSAGAFLAGLITIVGAYARILALAAETQITREQQRSEEILDHVLPARIAGRLRSGADDLTESFSAVTVLVADIAGFTPLAERMSPEALVRMLDEIVSRFDALCSAYEVEKIKTIGDAYVAAAGLTEPHDRGPARMVGLGTDMLAVLAEIRARTGHPVDLRVGIAAGPVVAGVVGKHKFSFELWGDAVTLAERLEAAGAAGSLLASEPVCAELGAAWRCTPAAPLTLDGREVATRFVAPAAG